MNTYHKLGIIFSMVLTALSAIGCSMAPTSKPIVSISSPAHGAQVNVGQEVLVQALAADAIGVVRIELWADGQLATAAQSPAPQTSQSALLRWTPMAAGAHLLLVKALNVGNVASDPAGVALNAVAANNPAPSPAAPVPTTAPVTAVPTVEPTKAAPCTSDAAFVEHVTVPDGTNWLAGQAFNKIWRVRNTGTCAWGPGDELVFVGGEAMTAQSTFIVPVTAPGATADLLAAMIAPASAGTHSGQWRLRDSKTGLFGATLIVAINVLDPLPAQVAPQAPALSNGGCPLPAIASFDAYTSLDKKGKRNVRLIWGKVDNADSAVIDQGIGGIPTPGGMDVDPAQTTTYTLTATGCGGTVSKQVTVNGDQSGNGGAIDISKLQLQPITGLVVKTPPPPTDLSKLVLQPMTGVTAKQMTPNNGGTTDISKLMLQPMTGVTVKKQGQ